MRLPLLLAALGLAALLFGYAGFALVERAQETPLSGWLDQQTRPVTLADAGAPLALRLAQDPPAAVLLVDPQTPALGEADRLAAYVQDGGQLWVVAPDPARALGPGLAGDVLALPGVIHSSAGGPATINDSGTSFTQAGALALQADPAWTPTMATGVEAFRDVNGDGNLTLGDPAGPFVVGIARPLGAGSLHVIALDPTVADPSPGLLAALQAGLPPGALLVAPSHHAAAWETPALTLARAAAILGAGGIVASVILALGAACLAVLFVLDARPKDPAREARDARGLVWLREIKESQPEYYARFAPERSAPTEADP